MQDVDALVQSVVEGRHQPAHLLQSSKPLRSRAVFPNYLPLAQHSHKVPWRQPLHPIQNRRQIVFRCLQPCPSVGRLRFVLLNHSANFGLLQLLLIQRPREIAFKGREISQTHPHTSRTSFVEPWPLKMRVTAFRWVGAVVGWLVALEASRN